MYFSEENKRNDKVDEAPNEKNTTEDITYFFEKEPGLFHTEGLVNWFISKSIHWIFHLRSLKLSSCSFITHYLTSVDSMDRTLEWCLSCLAINEKEPNEFEPNNELQLEIEPGFLI